MNFGFCLQGWIWRGACPHLSSVRSTGWTRVCKCSQPSLPSLQPLPAPEQTPSVAGGDTRSCEAAQHPIKTPDFPRGNLLLQHTGCRRDRSLGQGSLSSQSRCPELGIGGFSGHQGFQNAFLNSLFPWLGKQELLWLCCSGACRSTCLKSLQTWL